ncbi:MAG: Long-chain-fatty-acid--CoA ligase [Verrucomicrobiae bacterium]|nr:Long-chain-fatty-acid--CoA ligase [Verrucomicrobiae bacterium]
MHPPTFLAQFAQVAATHPRKVAIFWGTDRITYRQLREQIDRYALNLQHRQGLAKGDRVGLLLKNSPQFIYALYAALESGATVVPINTFLKTPEIQHIVDDCRLTCLVTEHSLRDSTAGLQRVSLVDVQHLSHPREGTPARPPVAASDLAVIIYTSGTTGKSKGALLTYGNFTANVQSCIAALDETHRDRITLLLPMFHSFMLTVCIFTSLAVGAGIVLIKSVQPFKLALREMIRNRATILVGIPQLFQAMAQAKLPFWLPWVLKIRLAISGAAPLPRETLDVFERKYRFPLLEGYGLSEAAPVVSFNPLHGTRKAGSVGLPLSGIEVKIFGDNGREVPTGEVGEIVVRGPNVMLGYYNQPDESSAALRNGWLHTGDMGKKDSDGYIYIVDRRKEMFLVRGMNVYPREIEEVLYTFPNVHEAAVIARRDDKRGESAVAFISTNEGTTVDTASVLKYCRERLADYKLPREIRIVDKLPRTATGKIAKLELKKLL